MASISLTRTLGEDENSIYSVCRKEETVERRFDGENGVIYNNYGFEEKYLKYSTP